MTLMELFQNDTTLQGHLTKIMTQRCRMSYKRDEIRALLGQPFVSMAEVYELHWFLHPNDLRRIKKVNYTPTKKKKCQNKYPTRSQIENKD